MSFHSFSVFLNFVLSILFFLRIWLTVKKNGKDNAALSFLNKKFYTFYAGPFYAGPNYATLQKLTLFRVYNIYRVTQIKF